jgi:rhodanese-related sulfurtransferase
MMDISTITPGDLAKLVSEGKKVDLIDVRTPIEYREVHVEIARNVPLKRLDPASVLQTRQGSPDDPIYVICRSGGRAQQGCEKFVQAGFEHVVNVEGGTLAWIANGLPVIRGERVVSLERQVRITAGMFVCLGAILSWWVHPAWLALCAFVGAGLIFAGITNTCCMALLLAQMPWNRGPDANPSCKCQEK